MKADKVVGGVLAAGLGCIVGAALGSFIGYWAGAAGWTEGGEDPWARALILGGLIGSVAGVAVLSILNRKRGNIVDGVIGGLIGIASEAAALAWICVYRS
jgi:hypothetical protein